MTAINRAVKLLEVVAKSSSGLGAREASAITGIPRTSAHRALEELRQNGFLNRDPATSRYQIGAGVLQLSMEYLSRLDIRQQARRHMERLRDETNETVGLSIRIGDERMYVEQIESRLELIRRSEIGKPYPLYCGAPGRILLASLDEDQVDEYLARVETRRFTPQTPIDKQFIKELVSEVRRSGFAAASAELLPDLGTVAAPLIDHSGATVAALSVSGPTSRFAPTSALTDLLDTARSISRQLGSQLSRDEQVASD